MLDTDSGYDEVVIKAPLGVRLRFYAHVAGVSLILCIPTALLLHAGHMVLGSLALGLSAYAVYYDERRYSDRLTDDWIAEERARLPQHRNPALPIQFERERVEARRVLIGIWLTLMAVFQLLVWLLDQLPSTWRAHPEAGMIWVAPAGLVTSFAVALSVRVHRSQSVAANRLRVSPEAAQTWSHPTLSGRRPDPAAVTTTPMLVHWTAGHHAGVEEVALTGLHALLRGAPR